MSRVSLSLLALFLPGALLLWAAGEARPYLPRDDQEEFFPSYLRERLHSILEGKAVSSRVLAEIEGGLSWQHPNPVPATTPHMLLSKLTGRDFAITRFQPGTLLVVTDSLVTGELTPRQMHCLAANVRTAWLQILLLAYTVQYTSRRKLLDNPAVLELAEEAQVQLNSLPDGVHFFAKRLADGRFSIIEGARSRDLRRPTAAAPEAPAGTRDPS